MTHIYSCIKGPLIYTSQYSNMSGSIFDNLGDDVSYNNECMIRTFLLFVMSMYLFAYLNETPNEQNTENLEDEDEYDEDDESEYMGDSEEDSETTNK